MGIVDLAVTGSISPKYKYIIFFFLQKVKSQKLERKRALGFVHPLSREAREHLQSSAYHTELR